MKSEKALLSKGSYFWKDRKRKDKVRIPKSQAALDLDKEN